MMLFLSQIQAVHPSKCIDEIIIICAWVLVFSHFSRNIFANFEKNCGLYYCTDDSG